MKLFQQGELHSLTLETREQRMSLVFVIKEFRCGVLRRPGIDDSTLAYDKR